MSPVLLEDLGQDLALMARVVQAQLGCATAAFFQRDVALAQKVVDKDDHVDNLLGLVEEKCFRRIASQGDAESAETRQLRGAHRLAVNLEKIGDYAVNIAEQAMHLARLPHRALPFDLAGPSGVALAALEEVITSFTTLSADKAKHACRCEIELDRQYREALQTAFERLRRPGEEPAFIVTNLFVAKFLERVGDSILNIGETTLFILTGERLKLHQYLHLEEMLGAVERARGSLPPVDLKQIWGGISGARVGRLSFNAGEALIWKEGAEGKIEEELREMGEWNRVVPGLVPDVKARHHGEGRESFLGQFLDGALLRDVYLTGSWEDKALVTRRLLETLREIWLATLRPAPARVDYVRQITDRLPELYAFHPELSQLRGTRTSVFGIPHRSLAEVLERLRTAEPGLAPKVLVRIHGDLNTNNVIYDREGDRVHFIDVHRSGSGDYLQDIGTLLVSNARMPIDDPRIVTDLGRLNEIIADFARGFARLVGDEHVETRLALARARSFITSARLVTDTDFARHLYLQGVHLLERVSGIAA